MGTSRQKDLGRRRTRRQRLARLRRQYGAARNQDERSQIYEKVRRVSPGLSLEEFAGQPRKAQRA